MPSNTLSRHTTSRFLKAQNQRGYGGYQQALNEIRAGRKTSHWIWYVFPQLRGLGYSSMSDYYGINGIAEAKRYMKNKTLRTRLREITRAALSHAGKLSAHDIFGSIDEIKVRSCWTLFLVTTTTKIDREIFGKALELFYDRAVCQKTIELLTTP